MPPGQGITFRFRHSKFIQDLRQKAMLMRRPQGPLRIVGQFITEVMKQAFDKEADPRDGSKWPALSPATVAFKKKKNRSGGALVFRGHLKRSIGYTLTMGKDVSYVSIGPSNWKAPIHHFGSFRGGGGRSGASHSAIPPRPFVGFSTADEKQIEKEITRYLRGV